MKKILFAAFAASLLAAGCQKTEVYQPANSGAEMTFSTGMSKLTKSVGTATAENSGQKNLEAQDFSVWAYANPGEDFSTSTAPIDEDRVYDGIFNLHVKCETASSPAEGAAPATEAGWTTDKQYYWPGADKNLMFFAVSAPGTWLRPTGQGATSPVTIEINPDSEDDTIDPTMTISNFTVGVEDENKVKDANVDLMVADYKIQDQTNKVVELTFRHTLSKVEFQFNTRAAQTGQTAPSVWVKSLELTNLKNSGTLTMKSNNAETGTNWDFDWTLTSEPALSFVDNYTETVQFGTDVENLTKDDTAMLLTTELKTFATWLMLPQGLNSSNQVKVTYVIDKREFTSVFDLTGKGENNTISEWVRNQYIKYQVTLAPNVISFKGTAEEWTPTSQIGAEN